MKLRETLVFSMFITAILFGVTSIYLQIQKLEKARIEKEEEEIKKELLVYETELKLQKLKEQKLKTEIETVRLQAFLKAYSDGSYIVEVETINR